MVNRMLHNSRWRWCRKWFLKKRTQWVFFFYKHETLNKCFAKGQNPHTVHANAVFFFFREAVNASVGLYGKCGRRLRLQQQCVGWQQLKPSVQSDWSWAVGCAAVRGTPFIQTSKQRPEKPWTRRSRCGSCHDGCGFTSTGCTAWLWMSWSPRCRGLSNTGTRNWWAFPPCIVALCTRWPTLLWRRSTHRRGVSEVGLWFSTLSSTRLSTSGFRSLSVTFTL